jgi:hypothetical protein
MNSTRTLELSFYQLLMWLKVMRDDFVGFKLASDEVKDLYLHHADNPAFIYEAFDRVKEQFLHDVIHVSMKDATLILSNTEEGVGLTIEFKVAGQLRPVIVKF